MTEKLRLEEIAMRTDYGAGMNGKMIQYGSEVARRWFRPGAVLELGPADGLSTFHLSAGVPNYEVIEASEKYCDSLRARFPQITVHNCLFEEFKPSKKFSTIVLGHVLEHVEDPGAILELVVEWLEPQGHLIAATPNGDSLHRQVGELSGLMRSRTDLNDADRSIGHRRVYTLETLQNLISSCESLEVLHVGGYFLKPFSNSQLDTIVDDVIAKALMVLGESYPQIAGDVYVVGLRK